MSKYDEDMGYIGKKIIGVQLGLVRSWFDATYDKKSTDIHLKNTPFASMHSDQLRMEQVVIK